MKKIRQLSEDELMDLINNSNDVAVVDEAELEYLRRMDTEDDSLLASFDEMSEYELEYIKKNWDL